MKKIIALAVASAFVAPVMAAEVNLNGFAEFAFTDENGATSTGLSDRAIYISASTETANGLTVSADINLDGDGGDDGGDSLDIAGPFGKLELGDTSSATDKFDDRTDKDMMVGGVGVSGPDAGVGWTLPAFVPGLTTYVSYGADTNQDGPTHTGVAIQYVAGPVSVAYGQNEGDVEADDSTYTGGTVTFAGLAVSVESMEVGTGATQKDEMAVGVTYSMGDLTLAATQTETEVNKIVTNDIMFYGVKYKLGGGVTAFAEAYSDDVDASNKATAIGVAFAF